MNDTLVLCNKQSPPRLAGRLRSFLARQRRLAAVLLLAAAALPAQTRQETGRQLLEKALEALGGQHFLNLGNVTQAGRAYSFYNRQLRGRAKMTIYTRYEPPKENAGPDWLPVSRREVYTEKGDYYALFQNGKGWEVTFRGARPFPRERIERYRKGVRRDIFFILRYRLNEPGMYFYHKGVEIIDNVPADAVQITDQDGDSVTVYLRQFDHLPVRQVYSQRDPRTRIPSEETSAFSKYRETGPVTLPWHTLLERDGDKIFEMFAHTVEINQNLDPGLFRLPQKLEILPVKP